MTENTPGYTPPDQEDMPKQGGKDVYEDGMIPVDEPVPQATIDAQEAAAKGQSKIADGIAGITDTDVLSALAKDGVTVEDLQRILKDSVTAQTAEMSALRQELSQVKQAGTEGVIGEDASIGGMPWMFWRLPNRAGFASSGRAGWIVYAPGGATPKGHRDAGSYTNYLRKGMVPVTKYGFIPPPTSPQAYLDSYLPILRASGGSAEFPASQVIAYNWHLRPPIKGLKFEQYEALKGSIKNWTCESCGDQRFFMPEDKEIGSIYRTHLMTDHKYPFREAAEAVNRAGFNLSPFAPASVEQMMERSAPIDA